VALARSTLIACVVFGAALGLAGGVGGFTFVYAKGSSYFGRDPAACANCHVMQGHYDAWAKGSHRSVAGCNDCHTPAGVVGKYATKARNGFWHSYYFTLGGFHEPIQITPKNHEITEGACRNCHADIVHAIDPHGSSAPREGQEVSCVRCHRDVGHSL
jgi:cytochrome c nitrite reductase small subunit